MNQWAVRWCSCFRRGTLSVKIRHLYTEQLEVINALVLQTINLLLLSDPNVFDHSLRYKYSSLLSYCFDICPILIWLTLIIKCSTACCFPIILLITRLSNSLSYPRPFYSLHVFYHREYSLIQIKIFVYYNCGDFVDNFQSLTFEMITIMTNNRCFQRYLIY